MSIEKNVFCEGRVHHICKSSIYASKLNTVLMSDDSGYTWKAIFSIPLTLVDGLKSCCDLSARLFRSGIYHIIDGGAFVLVFAYGRIWKYSKSDKTVNKVADIEGSRPLFVCNTRDGFFYGVYSSNPHRHPVSIILGNAAGYDWREIYSFTGIRHIHGIFNDPFTDSLWITTGDEDNESCIFRTDTKFSKVDKIIGGSQQFRAVKLIFTRDYVYFGSDTAKEKNYIYRLRRNDCEVERLQETGGSVMWGALVGEHVCFSTAVEPGAINKREYADLWVSDKTGSKWELAASFKKDIWPKKLFQYGQIFFPSGDTILDSVLFTPFATQGDMKTYRIKFKSPA